LLALVLSSCTSGTCSRAEERERADEAPRKKRRPERDECPRYADEYCARQKICDSRTQEYFYGDEERCREAVRRYCDLELHAPAGGDTRASIAQCADGLAKVACNDWLVGTLGDACYPPGSLENGAPCGLRAQCASYLCKKTDFDACGTCRPLPGEGDACPDGQCKRGFVCDGYSRCRSLQPERGPCIDDRSCEAGLACTPGGTCWKAAKTGEECDASWSAGSGCDLRAGDACIAGVCKKSPRGAQDAPCKKRGDCAGGYCDPTTSKCVRLKSIGERCDASIKFGGVCLYPGECISRDGEGVCEMPDLSKCK